MRAYLIPAIFVSALAAAPAFAQAPAGTATASRRVALGDLDNAEAALSAGKTWDARNWMERAETTLLNQESLAQPGDAATGNPLPERGILGQVKTAREALASDQSAKAQQDAQVAIRDLRAALLRAEQPR